MNLQYLGDAYDHWKGSIFEILQREKIVRDFRVDPMATDKWASVDTTLFARLLRIDASQIVPHIHELRRHRQAYFSEIPSDCDLFLDPDTGIRTGNVKHPEHYLLPSELFELLKANEDRLIIVYQHVRAQKVRQRVENVVAALKIFEKGFSCSSYESGTVALLFFSLRQGRAQSVRDHFCNFLGTHAIHRVGFWN